MTFSFEVVNNQKYITTSLSGDQLLQDPALNKGTGFTQEERANFGLLGKLPLRIETLNEQVARAYEQFKSLDTPLQQNLYLQELLNVNQTLLCKLAATHIREVLPIIYTPTVALAVRGFSREYLTAKGLYITYPEHDHLDKMLANITDDTDLIVVTDSERILGIGDQGVGGMHIPIAKLALYSICAGLHPARTLPIVLDIGTNNETLLNDPQYLGWRAPRIKGEEYNNFIEYFISKIKQKFPKVLLQWEDFARDNAAFNLNKYRKQLCSFNDDIQGTAVITLAALLSACKLSKRKLTEQNIVILGGGASGTGIADQIRLAMQRFGLDEKAARAKFWFVGRKGLITEQTTPVTNEQKPFLRTAADTQGWKLKNNNEISFFDVIANVKPSILIGCSTVGGAFTQEIVTEMAKHCEQPIILPLSNPTDKAEAKPIDLINWTCGCAIVATGSPFDDVEYQGKKFEIAQCNNMFAFPGIGLGTIASQAREVTNNMFWAACQAISELALAQQKVLPPIEDTITSARKVAAQVAAAAQADGVARANGDPQKLVDDYVWEIEYLPYKKR